MLWRLQMAVCVLLMCVCLCVNASRVDVSCPGEQACRELISQEALLTCLRVCAFEHQIPYSASLAELQEHLAPPPMRRGAAEAGGGDDDDAAGGEEEDSEEEEQGVALGLLLSILSSSPVQTEEARSAERRAYSMEHFRWGKPTGRKRRPVKVYTSGGAAEALRVVGGESRRSLGSLEEEEREEEEEEERERERGREVGGVVQVRVPPLLYRMSHFRWSPPLPSTPSPVLTPPPDKRYGGFMKPWTAAIQPSHKPLLTLFRHAIARNGH